uniref:Uncharacterized protein n=1 Tax=candidate division WOR-3 bacterium TaxID=2052148 RepID=A0A7C4YQR6_UNCW3
MEKKEIEKIVKKKIMEDYPEFSDVKPSISEKILEISEGEFKKVKMKPVSPKKVWIAVFKKVFQRDDGSKMVKIVRATVSKDGEIIKITESH